MDGWMDQPMDQQTDKDKRAEESSLKLDKRAEVNYFAF